MQIKSAMTIIGSEPAAQSAPKAPRWADVCEYDEEESGDDDDDAGSLVDFIVDDRQKIHPEPDESGPTGELDGMDSRNIIEGKRKRRQTRFYETEVFGSVEYKRMVLEDVPPDEMHALDDDSSEDGGGGEEDDDDSYDGESGAESGAESGDGAESADERERRIGVIAYAASAQTATSEATK